MSEERRTKPLWNILPKTETVFELKVAKDVGQFSARPVNKAVPSFTSSLIRVRERWQKTF